MANIGKGSRIKFTLHVEEDSLGGNKLNDETVGFSVDFYAKEKKDSVVTAYYNVAKEDASFNTDGDAVVVCETGFLDYGRIYASLTVNYDDDGQGGTGKRLKEIITLTSDVTIVEAPAIPSDDDDTVSVTVKANTVTRARVGSSVKYNATVAGTTAPYDKLWKSSDSTVARVDNTGNVTGYKAGTAQITCLAVSGNLVLAQGALNVEFANANYSVIGQADFVPSLNDLNSLTPSAGSGIKFDSVMRLAMITGLGPDDLGSSIYYRTDSGWSRLTDGNIISALIHNNICDASGNVWCVKNDVWTNLGKKTYIVEPLVG